MSGPPHGRYTRGRGLTGHGLRSRKGCFRGWVCRPGQGRRAGRTWKAGRRGSHTQCACSTWGHTGQACSSQAHSRMPGRGWARSRRPLGSMGMGTCQQVGTAEPHGGHRRGSRSPKRGSRQQGRPAGRSWAHSKCPGRSWAHSRPAGSSQGSWCHTWWFGAGRGRGGGRGWSGGSLPRVSFIPRPWHLGNEALGVFLVAACCFSSSSPQGSLPGASGSGDSVQEAP